MTFALLILITEGIKLSDELVMTSEMESSRNSTKKEIFLFVMILFYFLRLVSLRILGKRFNSLKKDMVDDSILYKSMETPSR